MYDLSVFVLFLYDDRKQNHPAICNMQYIGFWSVWIVIPFLALLFRLVSVFDVPFFCVFLDFFQFGMEYKYLLHLILILIFVSFLISNCSMIKK